MSDNGARPFIKWAGGKRQLLEEFSKRMPPEIKDGGIDTFVEPFIGGGAVFFYINSTFSFEKCHIFDINRELTLVYSVVRNNVEGLIEYLSGVVPEYLSMDEARRKKYYYKVREEFNAERENFYFDIYDESWIKRAGELIFLNKTCFNGLFRVNSKGGFNVPFGKYKNPKIIFPEILRACSDSLQNTEIHTGDFSDALPYITDKTFVYLDPPYRPISSTSSFTSYAKDGFGDDEQIRLAEFFVECDEIGAKLMLSNSDPKNIDPKDDFFDELYADYNIERVPAKRQINSDASRRGEINEIIVTNY